MKIDPCPVVITLKDGKNSTMFRVEDFLDLVDQYMGYDAARWLREHLEQLDEAANYTLQKAEADANSDLTNYEHDLERHTTAFQEIEEQAKKIMEVLQAPRMNRQAISHAIREIGLIIQHNI